jgi:hypothetical protein
VRIAKHHRKRQGITTVAVLACLVFVTLISGVLLKVGIAYRDHVRAQERKLQADWLAQSGIERALARLADKADYTGETWTISKNDLDADSAPREESGPAALVTIRVERPGGSADRRMIKVQADIPPEPSRRIRHTNQVLVELGSPKTGASR